MKCQKRLANFHDTPRLELGCAMDQAIVYDRPIGALIVPKSEGLALPAKHSVVVTCLFIFENYRTCFIAANPYFGQVDEERPFLVG